MAGKMVDKWAAPRAEMKVERKALPWVERMVERKAVKKAEKLAAWWVGQLVDLMAGMMVGK